MALDNQDKDFIKKTIEDAVNKSNKDNQQKMSDAINSNNKSLKEQSKKDRQVTLEYLDKVGVLTLAEKVELMKNNISKEIKQTVKEAVPEDLTKNLKNTFKGSATNIGKGLNQGKDSIKSFMRGDILGGMGSALSGSINASIGLLQGATGIAGGVVSGVGAAASILSAKAKMTKKKKTKLNEDGTFTEVTTKQDESSKQNPLENTSKILETRQQTPRSKEEDENKTTTGILKKGLGGISKGLETATTVLNFLATKQKLILAGIGAGVVGILALVGWFQDGGMDRLIGKIKEGMLSDHAKTARTNANNVVSTELNKLKEQSKDLETIDNATKQNVTKISGSKALIETTDNFVKQATNAGINEDVAKDYAKTRISSKNGLQFRRSNTQQQQTIKFPFPIRIVKIYGQEYPKAINIRRTDQGAWGTSITFTKVIDCKHTEGTTVKENMEAFKVDAAYEIIGDWEYFLQKKEDKSIYETLVDQNKYRIAHQATQVYEEGYEGAPVGSKLIDEKITHFKGYNADTIKGMSNGTISTDVTLSSIPATQEIKQTITTEETPSVSIKETAKNTEQAQKNIEKLNEIDKKQKQQAQEAQNITSSNTKENKPTPVINVINNSPDNDAYSTFLTKDQHIRAANNQLTI